MKLAINLALSLGMLAICTWWVWPDAEKAEEIKLAFSQLRWAEFAPYLSGSILLLAVTHFCRAWRWNNLLRPIGVDLPPGRLLAISSVGFMAILALPARLGEFVRPALIRRRGHISASEALGTVAVERIIDGLLISVFVFAAVFALKGWESPFWAYLALAIFSAATVFLVFALRWPQQTVGFALNCSLLPWISPKAARYVGARLHSIIRGFMVLEDKKNLAAFVLWSVAYWAANGVSLWLLAKGFHLDLSVIGAFATMGVIAVGITLPNSPGLVGQYHGFALVGLALYLPSDIVDGPGYAFVITMHAIQVVWYMGIGALALASKHVSFAEVVQSRKLEDDDNNAGAPQSDTT